MKQTGEPPSRNGDDRYRRLLLNLDIESRFVMRLMIKEFGPQITLFDQRHQNRNHNSVFSRQVDQTQLPDQSASHRVGDFNAAGTMMVG